MTPNKMPLPKLSITLDPKDHKKARLMAAMNGCSVSQLVISMIYDRFAKLPPQYQELADRDLPIQSDFVSKEDTE